MTADSELRRTHPATVAVRTLKTVWQGLLAAVGLAILGVIEGLGWASLGIFAFILLTALVGAGVSWLNWHFFRYGIVGGDLLITEGWLVRRRRTIPLARVQGVDFRADVFMRFFGLADVVVQTAGGGSEPEAKIGAIALADAERLRFTLLHGRTFAEPEMTESGGTDDAADAAAQPLTPDIAGRMSDVRGVFGGAEQARVEPSFEYRVPVGRLALAAVSSRTLFIVMAAMLGAAAQVLDFVDSDTMDTAIETVGRLGTAIISASVISLLAVVVLVAIAVSVSRDFGFVARRVAERVETEAGLFERRMKGLPVRRIQAVIIDEAPLRRLLGWVSVQVVSAGSAAEKQASASSSSVVPIARREELYPLLHRLLPEAAGFPKLAPLSHRALRFYLTVPTVTTVVIFATAAVAVSLVADSLGLWVVGAGAVTLAAVYVWCVLAWRNAAFGADAVALGIARGVLGRKRVRIGRSRIQSLTVRQNPFQRRAGLATVIAAGVSGSSGVRYQVRHLGAADAARIMDWYSKRPEAGSEPA